MYLFFELFHDPPDDLGAMFLTVFSHKNIKIPWKYIDSEITNLSVKEYPNASDKIRPTVVFPEPIIPEFHAP
jgi:hypothetical protein